MRLSTGIELLNRRLDGGFPPGSLVALTAPPETQSELLLSELASERSTCFVSTIRPAAEVETDVGANCPDLSTTRAGPDELLDAPSRVLDGVEERSNLVVDPVDVVEDAGRSEYLDFLDEVKARVEETGSVAVLSGVDADPTPAQRRLTLKRADLVMKLFFSVKSREVTTSLVVSKFRGGSALKEPIKLLLTDRVRIDTSRDIA